MFLASNGSKQLVLMNSRSKCPFFFPQREREEVREVRREGEGGGEKEGEREEGERNEQGLCKYNYSK